MSRCQLQAYYSGRVQGAGFRYRVKNLAAGFEVLGSVRNLADGRVELVAEGTKEELQEFQKIIRESELGSLIRNEETNWNEAKNEFKGFQIIG